MIAVIQRVLTASVTVDGEAIGAINKGIVALVAVEKGDTCRHADRLLERILNYRIFPDDRDRMNLSLLDIGGGLLLVPQFTLAADTQKGNRPSFTSAAPPEQGQKLFEYLLQRATGAPLNAQFGRFGADMQVALINDGPVTFTLRTHGPGQT
ncbi:MAG: D-aminoacyl-tRNA deacylase [Gammaproteobacteria bacterium]